MTKTLILITAILTCCTLVWADPPSEALLLEEGAYGTIVQGGINEGETRAYYLMGHKGQLFKASVVSVENNAYLSFSDSKGKSLLGHLSKAAKIKNLDIVIPQTGRYKLEISTIAGVSSYLLEVTLDDPPPPSSDNP